MCFYLPTHVLQLCSFDHVFCHCVSGAFVGAPILRMLSCVLCPLMF